MFQNLNTDTCFAFSGFCNSPNLDIILQHVFGLLYIMGVTECKLPSRGESQSTRLARTGSVRVITQICESILRPLPRSHRIVKPFKFYI